MAIVMNISGNLLSIQLGATGKSKSLHLMPHERSRNLSGGELASGEIKRCVTKGLIKLIPTSKRAPVVAEKPKEEENIFEPLPVEEKKQKKAKKREE